ncbi:ferrous iron transport protein A [Chloroflexota bacterium]
MSLSECPRCSQQTLPLNMAAAGETVQLIKINGGRRMRKRLADLGLNIGMSLRVVQSAAHGPMLLAFKDDARLAIGQGITSKIIVAPYEININH